MNNSMGLTLLSLLGIFASVQAFTIHPRGVSRAMPLSMAADQVFDLMVKIPPTDSGLVAQMKIESILPGPSEIVEIRYGLPFGLDVAPEKGMAICTKDGAGGEKVGDVLRYTTQWTMGLPRGDGLATTAASFAGGVSWQCNMFDILAAGRWEEVVEALVSNVPERTDEVVLIFERPLEE